MFGKYCPGETQQINMYSYVQIIDDTAHFLPPLLVTIFLLYFMVISTFVEYIRLALISMSLKKKPKSSLPTGYLIYTSAISCNQTIS